MNNIEDRTFLLLLVLVTLLFIWVLLPLSGAILWAMLLAIVFAQPYRWLLERMPRWRNIAALFMLLVIVLMVILPLLMITASLLQEASSLYESYRSGEFKFRADFTKIRSVLPEWTVGLLNHFELTGLSAVQERFAAALTKGVQFLAGHALTIGQSTMDFVIGFFVMLYLLFFLLRDGDGLVRVIIHATPISPKQQRALFSKFTATVRATVKGDIIVALVQGMLGGLMFWFLEIRAAVLWGVVMAVLALLPIVGSALVWAPVAVYLLLTGFIWQGILLFAYGALVISLIDNVFRPILIGQDIRMPSYMVLISTLGGLSIFGVNGFVIGPVVAAMFIAAWDIFSELKRDDERDPIDA
jgi:predicted PurR-regulated permease PerM